MKIKPPMPLTGPIIPKMVLKGSIPKHRHPAKTQVAKIWFLRLSSLKNCEKKLQTSAQEDPNIARHNRIVTKTLKIGETRLAKKTLET